MRNDSAQVERVFRALGDSTRRAVFEAVCRRPSSISELSEPLSITLAAVTQHVQVLEDSGLIVTEKVGRVRTCQARPEGVSILTRWVEARRSEWERRFDRLNRWLAVEEPSSSGRRARAAPSNPGRGPASKRPKPR
jgi:DNA-binding transcriptional ArsR family regulator